MIGCIFWFTSRKGGGALKCGAVASVQYSNFVVTFSRKARERSLKNQKRRKLKERRRKSIRNTRNIVAQNTNTSVQNTRNTKTKTSRRW